MAAQRTDTESAAPAPQKTDGAAPARRIKVLVVGPTPPPYHGVATFTRDLLAGAHDPRFELLHLDTSDRRDASNIGTCDLTNIRLGLTNLAQLAWRCARARPDIVYIPISQSVPGFLRDALFILQARLLRRRIVLHLHGGYFRQTYEAGNGLFRWLARLALRRAAAVIVLGEKFRPIFSGLVPAERVHVVENGVPDPGAWALQQQPDVTGASRPCILYLGTLTRTKGILELIRAVALLRRSLPEARLRVAGEWDSGALRAEAAEIIAREGLADHVTFVGNVSGAEKAAFLASGAVLCLPTRYPYEGQPLVILEAMAAGLPVVATDHGVIASTVVDGTTGRLLPTDSTPETLAATVGALLSDQKTLEEFGLRSRQRYLEHYTLEACHRQLFDVFDAARGS